MKKYIMTKIHIDSEVYDWCMGVLLVFVVIMMFVFSIGFLIS